MVHVFTLAAAAYLVNRRAPTADTRRQDADANDIRCPQCGWQPQKSDRWVCEPGCLHRWNTFDTAGICPACEKHWNETACLSCGAWSPHADWYRPAS